MYHRLSPVFIECHDLEQRVSAFGTDSARRRHSLCQAKALFLAHIVPGTLALDSNVYCGLGEVDHVTVAIEV